MLKVSGHIQQDHFKTRISNGRNELLADEPINNGGLDLGFSPTEILCSALAACTCVTLRMYADKKQWPLTDVKAYIKFSKDNEANISHFEREVELMGNLTAEQKDRLIQIANQCPIHKILTHPINIATKLI